MLASSNALCHMLLQLYTYSDPNAQKSPRNGGPKFTTSQSGSNQLHQPRNTLSWVELGAWLVKLNWWTSTMPYVIQICYTRSHDPSQVQLIWPGLSKSGMVQPGNCLVNQTTLDYEHCTSRWVQMQITLVPPVRPNKQWTVWECYTSRYTCVLNDYHNIPNQQWELA